MASDDLRDRVFALERPHANLLTYYFLQSLVVGPFFPIVLLPRYLRYLTLRYRFDEEGLSIRWGVLFRREVHLTYARIQDIHLRSNVVERWLGLARVEIQTASASAKAEMTIEGLLESDQVRDFLYSRMRGVKEAVAVGESSWRSRRAAGPPASESEVSGEVAAVLREVSRELRAIRIALGGRGAPSDGSEDDV